MNYKTIKCGIYIIRNTITNKVYIGSSLNPRARIKEHFNSLNKNVHHSKYLQRSYNKYGKSVFKVDIIEYVNDKKDLLSKEQFWIDYYDSYKKGYNVCRYAGNTLGLKCSEKNKIKAHKRMAGKNNPMYGKTHTLEVKKLISDLRYKMPPATKDFREKMSKVTIGENNGMYGKNHSNKARLAISKKVKKRGGHKGEKNPNYGNKWTEEQKESLRISVANRGGMKGGNNSNYGNTKIKKSKWIEIYHLVKQKKIKVADLARQYNVHIQTIYNIIKNQEVIYE